MDTQAKDWFVPRRGDGIHCRHPARITTGTTLYHVVISTSHPFRVRENLIFGREHPTFSLSISRPPKSNKCRSVPRVPRPRKHSKPHRPRTINCALHLVDLCRRLRRIRDVSPHRSCRQGRFSRSHSSVSTVFSNAIWADRSLGGFFGVVAG